MGTSYVYGYGGGGTSSSTYGGTWTTASVSYETKLQATILETKPPAQEWSHVTKVGVKTGGYGDSPVYKIGDLVSVTSDPSGPAIIMEFGADYVQVRMLGSNALGVIGYKDIKLIGPREAEAVKLDPNTAFKYKKKRMPF